MTDVLVDVLRDRAELAPDSDHMWEDILRGIDARRGRRRATVAAAGASAAVVAAAVTAVIVVPARPPHQSAVPGNQAPAPAWTAPKPSSPAPTVAPKATRLVPAPAVPAAAKLTLGVLPAGWMYLGASPSNTTYSDHAGSPDDFAGKLVVLLGDSGQAQHPIKIGGHAAAIWTSTGFTIVEIWLGPQRYLTVQVPPSLKLTRTQLVQLGASVTVRPGAAPGHG
jgi:hypothetical protein